MAPDTTTLERLEELRARVGGAGPDGMLDREVALALGWQERKVTRLGVNGRTPGRWMWFEPWGSDGRRLPSFTGPRKRAASIAALSALIEKEKASS